MTLRFTILGCGSSTGVPRVGGDWGQCNPANPRNRRRRCSLLVERTGFGGQTTVLIDTSPDLREQLLDAGVTALDAVLYTHDHADHTHGIDDLRMLSYAARRKINIYADERTLAILRQRFDYCFETPAGSGYPPIVRAHELLLTRPLALSGAGGEIVFQPFRQLHGDIESLGFRIGGLAYSSDLHDLPEESLRHLEGLDVWIVDALRYVPHPSHFHLDRALSWIERLKPKRAILTHLHIDLDYDALRAVLPGHVVPAHDGMVIELPDEGLRPPFAPREPAQEQK
jgi:phosphoribosyl 1,2-cyclic phosphate phosphodiesterase